MSNYSYININRIFSKLYREYDNEELNETDIIEWTGEALEFLKVPQIQEEAVTFMEVKNFEVELPLGFHLVLQVAKDNQWTPKTKKDCYIPKEEYQEILQISNCTIEEQKTLCEEHVEEYKPYFDMQWQYINWTVSSFYKKRFTPVKLSSNTFFNSIVCKELDQTPYSNCKDEYTIVGSYEKKLRFSFKEGYIALAYLKNKIDKETGYPLIPDDMSFITAITYYIKWKLSEINFLKGREGFGIISKELEAKWLKYCRQAKNNAKMPKSLDDYQDLLLQTHKLIPVHNRHFNYFGHLTSEENKAFNGNVYDNHRNY